MILLEGAEQLKNTYVEKEDNNNDDDDDDDDGNDEENATAKTMSEMPENCMKLPKNDKTAAIQTTATAGQKILKKPTNNAN